MSSAANDTLPSRIIWFNLLVEASLPLLTLYGCFTTNLHPQTLQWCICLYFLNMLGYHRLWSHRSYVASWPLQWFLCAAGSGAIQGSILWWARLHRAHHRYTDTSKDPYGAHEGFWHTHLGWMLVRPATKRGTADATDLRNNALVWWQHRHFFELAFLSGIIFPAWVAGRFWGDWRGGVFYACFARLFFVHHSVFCVNSVAHYIGERTYDDRLSPRDSIVTAVLTLGEGYHNFHHQFPVDYRNAVRWYQYDPTKWFIATCAQIGLASHLKVFPEGEIEKSRLTMQLKQLKSKQDRLQRPPSIEDLPVITWDMYVKQAQMRSLMVVAGFVHDVSDFMDDHPGGRALVVAALGTDATANFFGGVYDHSNAAHNLLSGLRVGVLLGGLEHMSETAARPPWQKWEIIEHKDSEGRTGHISKCE
ncbi:delta 9-fatty acid desaturase protein [Vararia minispora EC-137]|uniref:Delta 9-fatty acid desaturase protein n=1 Tax=Vararia minispora EC-137 TaxID=1314806 RepID=A0ACB8QR93_9AGAM|nr:delta 9-fatty acid desaturase protein [Vararia minispora EC-137]